MAGMQTLLPLSAGPCRMLLDPDRGHLRRLRLGGAEAVRGVYAAVRAEDWRTVPPRIEGLEVDRGARDFRIRFRATHEDPAVGVAFRWTGTIVGRATGLVTYDFDGEALADFRSNRIGFCVLHPGALPPTGVAGEPFTLTAPDESTSEGRFPRLVSPSLPMVGVRSIRRPIALGGAAAFVNVLCEGEVFETEDQRNWSDASFKTYVRPSSLPRPFDVRKGEVFRQRVTVTLDGLPAGFDANAESPSTVELKLGEPVAVPRLRLATDADAATPSFVEVNSHRPDASVDRIAFTLHPQIHQTDDLTIAESFVTHGLMVATVCDFAPSARVSVGPIRFAPPGPASGQRSAVSGQDADPRVGGDLHAAWLLASLTRLVQGGAAEVVWDGAGWADRPDSPVAKLFASLSEKAGPWTPITSTRPDEVAALAVGDTLFVANAWHEPRRVAPPSGWGEPIDLAPYSFAIRTKGNRE
jgi:hypothetical protein